MLVKDFLEKHDSACQDAQQFLESYTDMADAWDQCPRADWMFWALSAEKIELSKEVSVAFACWCVRNTPVGNGKVLWDLLEDPRSKAGVEAAEQYMRGEITLAQMEEAADAAYASYAAASAASAACAASAAHAAASAAAYYAAAYYAAAYYAAAHAAAYYAASAAAHAAHAAQAEELKKRIPNPFRATVSSGI